MIKLQHALSYMINLDAKLEIIFDENDKNKYVYVTNVFICKEMIYWSDKSIKMMKDL